MPGIVIRPPEERNQLEEAARTVQAQGWTQPDVVARDKELAARLGVDPTPAEALRPLYESAVKAQDARSALDGAPKAQRMFSDPAFAAVSHDSVQGVAWWEKDFAGIIGGLWSKTDRRKLLSSAAKALVVPSAPLFNIVARDVAMGARQFGEGQRDMQAIAPAMKSLTGAATPEEDKAWIAGVLARRLESESPGFSPLGNAARVLPQILYGADPALITTGAAGGAIIGSTAGGVGAVPGAIVGAGAGLGAGMTAASFETNAAMAYEELRLMKDEVGDPLDPDVARMAALAVGTLAAPLDVIGLGFIGKATGLSRLSQIGIRSALQRPTVRAALSRLSMDLAGATTAEGLTEAGQQAIQIIVTELAKDASGQPFKDITLGEAAEQIGTAGAQGGITGFVFGGAAVSGRAPFALGEVERANAAQQAFEAIAQNAADTPLKGRDAAAYREAVQGALRDGPVDAVYVNAEAFREFFQSNKEDAYAAAESVGIARAVLDEALREGGDIAIPVGEFAAKMAGSPADAALRRHFKLRPEDKSLAEIEEIKANYPELQAELDAQAQERAQADATESGELESIRALMTERLRATNAYDEPTLKAVVEPMVAAYRTAAARRGVSVGELAASIPPPQVAGRMSRVVRPTVVPADVAASIRDAAQSTGVSDSFLSSLASRESSFNPRAQAETSSAAGLFQFTEGTWLRTLRANPELGVAIPEGRIDPATRRSLLDMRFDPDLSARAAGLLTRENAAALSRGLGRAPDDGELYIAHFLGSNGALRLLNAEPGTDAADVFPEAARANRSIFYGDKGVPRSVAQVIGRLKRGFDGSSVQVEPAAPAAGGDGRPGIFQPREEGDADTLEQSDIRPVIEARQIMDAYRQRAGVEREPLRVKARPRDDVMTQIADAYEAAASVPDDATTRRAYQALTRETLAQFRFLGDLRVEAWTQGGEPYANSASMMDDVRNNGHLWFFPTTEGFGEGADTSGNILLEPSGEYLADGRPLLNNDVFRIVHDFFGHVPSSLNFGPVGELNAFLEHASMFSDDALPALAAETLMQNAWVNFGPHLRRPDGTLPKKGDPDYVPIPQRRFADQKMFAAPQSVIDAAFGLRAESEGTQGTQAGEGRDAEGQGADGGAVGDSRPSSFAGSGDALQAPPVEADGTIRLWHWGKRGRLKSLDPERWGDNWDILPREEKQRIGDAPGRTYYGIAVGQAGGYIPEGGLGPHRYEAAVPAERLYDFRSDPDRLVEKARAAAKAEDLEPGDAGYGDYLASFYETAIKDAGWAGYWVNDPSLGLVAAVYERIPVRYVENERTGQTFYQSAQEAEGYDPGLGFRSAVHEVVLKGAKRASGDQWLATIRNAPGVKKEEIEWLGLEEFLTGRDALTREELAAYVAANGVRLIEVVQGRVDPAAVEARADEMRDEWVSEYLDDVEVDARDHFVEAEVLSDDDLDPDDDREEVTVYRVYGPDGGETFDSEAEAEARAEELNDEQEQRALDDTREMAWEAAPDFTRDAERELEAEGGTTYEEYQAIPGGENYRELLLVMPSEANDRLTQAFRAGMGHWGHDNVLAHTRLADFKTPDGRKVLGVLEIQSDWHQKGRDQGYAITSPPEVVAAAEERLAAALAERDASARVWADKVRGVMPSLLANLDDGVVRLRAEVERLAAKRQEEASKHFKPGDVIRWRADQEDQRVAWVELSAQYAGTLSVANAAERTADNLRDAIRRFDEGTHHVSADARLRIADAVLTDREYWGDIQSNARLQAVRDDLRRAKETDLAGPILRAREAAQEVERLKGAVGIPDAPFKSTWPALVMKRVIKEAVEGGYDAVAWATGEQQADLYDMRQRVGRVGVMRSEDAERVKLSLEDRSADNALRQHFGATGEGPLLVDKAQLRDLFGAALGDRIWAMGQENDPSWGWSMVEAEDFMLGGEGHKAFYNRNLVNITNDLVKKFGTKVGVLELPNPDMQEKRASDEAVAANLKRDLRDKQAMLAEERAGANDPEMVDKLERRIALTQGSLAQLEARLASAPAGSKQWGFEITDKMREAVVSSGLTLFQDDRSTVGQPRGSITLPRGGFASGREAVIALGDAADASTFLHESGHFFLEMLVAMAAEPDAPQQMRDDLLTTLQWFGVNSPDEIGRDQHEMWAEGFEQYLFEGRAPSTRLQAVFESFRAWLAFIYRQLKGIRPDLSDDVRAVMDRILATDEEIAEARAGQGMEPLFKSAEDAGVDQATWESYQALHRAAVASANEEANTRALRAARREAEAWYRDRKTEVRDGIEELVRARPVYRAFEWLAHGVWVNGEPPEDLPAMKLSREAIVQDYGEDRLKALPRGFRPVWTREPDGVHPDIAAATFGFSSGDELLRAMSEADRYAVVVERETEQAMIERYGDPVAQGMLADVAMDAVHNVDQGRVFARELRMMQGRATTRGVAEAAGQDIGKRSVGDLLRIDRHLQAERRAGMAAQEAWRKGDKEEAARQKFKQLAAYHAWRAAREANEEIGKARKYFARFDNSTTRKAIAKPYRDQIDDLLEQYDFRQATRTDVAERVSLRQLRDALIAEGREAEVNFDDEVLDRIGRAHYTELTMDQLRGLRDTIKNLDTLGRRENQLLTDERARAREIAVQELLHAAVTSGAKPIKAAPIDPEWTDKLQGRVRSVHAFHLRPEFLMRRLDGLKDNGPWWRYLFKPLADASAVKADLMDQTTTRLREIMERLDRAGLWRKRVFIPEINESVLGKSLLSVALNWGNEDNRAALQEGQGWDDAQMAAVIDVIPAEFWSAAQAIWDLLETLRDPAFSLEEDLTGIRPTPVQPAPVNTKFGTFPGGYYPLAYDAARNIKVEQEQRAGAIEELFGIAGSRPMTRRGHLKARVGSGGRPVRLDLGVMTDHIEAVIHDVAYRRAVIDIDKLTQSPIVAEAIRRHMGYETLKLIRPWLVEVAKPRVDPRSGLERGLMRLRLGSSVVNMGWKFTTALVQPLGITGVMTRLGPRALAAQATLGPQLVAAKLYQSVMRWLDRPETLPDKVQFIMQRSAVMRDRMITFDRDANDLMRRNMDGWWGDLKRSFFYFTGLLDLTVSGPAWLTAYDLAREGRIDGVDPANEPEIIAFADSVVRTTVGSGETKDLPDAMRGPEIRKLFTGFYSYFSLLYNQLYTEQVPGFRSGAISPAQFVANIALLWFVPAVLSELMTGRVDDEDDGIDREDLEALALKVAVYPASTVVVLRDIVSVLGTDFDYKLTPVAAGLEAMTNAVKGAMADVGEFAETGDIAPSKTTVKNAFMATGYWVGLPARQLWLTGEYVYDWLAGEVEEFNPFHALVTRPRE